MSEQRSRSEEAVNLIEETAGIYPGFRRAHARGSCFRAVFKPTGRAAELTTAPHLQSEEIQAVVRFSNSSPNPGDPDAFTPPKGMAVRFELPGGGYTNLIAVTVPVFPAKTPETFIEFMRAAKAAKKGCPDAKDYLSLLQKVPELKAGAALVKNLRLPSSLAMCRYYSIHAFYWVNEEGVRTPVKYQWEPDDGVSMLEKKDFSRMPSYYLLNEFRQRLQKGPVSFTLTIQIGTDDDPADDPSIMWPADRKTLEAGKLIVYEEMEDEGEDYLFDPTVLPEGIECTEDPILRLRHEAYAYSYQRRVEGK